MEVFKGKTHDDLVKFVESFSKFLESIADMLKAYAEYEVTVRELFGSEVEGIDFSGLLENEEFRELIRSSDPELLGRFMLLMLDFIDVTKKFKKIDDLSPEEKLELSDKLKKLAEEFKSIMLEERANENSE